MLQQVEELEEGIIKEEILPALRKIGLERIPAVGIQHGNGYNLVSKDKRPAMPGRI